MKILNQTILFLLTCLLLQNCSTADIISPGSDDPCAGLDKSMPEATNEGKGTFGCLINGEPWVAYNSNDIGDQIFGAEPELEASYSNGSYARIVYIEECDSVSQSFIFHFHSDDQDDNGINHFTGASKFYNWHEGYRYKTDSLANNQIFINKLDLENRIISCTFSFQLINADAADTIRVTEGRFDTVF